MAVAIASAQPVRDVEAIAERPDGGRSALPPLPHSGARRAGTVIGAVNLLVPVDGNTRRDLIARRRQVPQPGQMGHRQAAAQDVLTGMAKECERHAAALRLD